jgi:hypothetical protein
MATFLSGIFLEPGFTGKKNLQDYKKLMSLMFISLKYTCIVTKLNG